MTIVVTATDRQWSELACTGKKESWLRVEGGGAFMHNKNADAFINLEESHVLPCYAELTKPVFINAVTATLSGMNAPENVLRINGWLGFLQRPAWEIAGKIDDRVRSVAEQLDKKIIPVADEPGLVAARIISMIINEAYFALGDGVSSKNEIDTAMKLGTNYPYGPFEWASVIGLKHILELLQKLNITDKRYQPAALLLKEATENNP